MKGAQGPGDLQSRQIARIRKQLGNQQMGKAGNGAQMRDNLLGFVCERLRTLRAIQLKEYAQFDQVRHWFRAVARGQEGFHVPDPTRWHEAARFFKEAAEAMCHGNLSRGAQLLERAMSAEKAAYDSMPEMVRDDLEAEEKSPSGYPAELPHALSEAALPRCQAPKGLVLADQILALNDEFEETPPSRAKTHRKGWWDEEEEEVDEEKKEGEKTAAQKEAEARGPTEPDLEAQDEETERAPPERSGPAHEQPDRATRAAADEDETEDGH